MATNASRYTDKGNSFEKFCHYLLYCSKYNVEEQVYIGLRPTGGGHIVDLEVVNDEYFNVCILISLKYQEVDGSAYEKLLYEQVCLQAACEEYGYTKAYIILAGDGWKHGDSFRKGAFSKWVTTPNVFVLDFDEFLSEFNLTDNYNKLIPS